MIIRKEELNRGKTRYAGMRAEERIQLQNNIIAGLPVAKKAIRWMICELQLTNTKYRYENFAAAFDRFLKEVIPVAEEAGIKMAIHPDDPSI